MPGLDALFKNGTRYAQTRYGRRLFVNGGEGTDKMAELVKIGSNEFRIKSRKEMINARWCHGLNAFCENFILATGGFEKLGLKTLQTNLCEVYDIR